MCGLRQDEFQHEKKIDFSVYSYYTEMPQKFIERLVQRSIFYILTEDFVKTVSPFYDYKLVLYTGFMRLHLSTC